MIEGCIKRSQFILIPDNRILYKKLQPFLVWHFLTAVNKGYAVVHGECPDSKSLVIRAKPLKLGSIPTVFIVIGSKIKTKCLAGKRTVVVADDRIELGERSFARINTIGDIHRTPGIG